MLDLCCGTGDFALAALQLSVPPARIVGVDLAPKMIEHAKMRLDACNATDQNVEFLVGDALSLPFGDNSFDCITVGFGVRNFNDRLLGLKEIARVLKVGGTLLVLEFGELESRLISLVYTPYAKYALPLIGGWITGNHEAYKYLHRTSLSFPGGKNFLPILEQAGLSNRDYRTFYGGIAYAYTASKV